MKVFSKKKFGRNYVNNIFFNFVEQKQCDLTENKTVFLYGKKMFLVKWLTNIRIKNHTTQKKILNNNSNTKQITKRREYNKNK